MFSTSPLTAAGDTTRSDFILTQLQTGNYRYSPQTGIGTTGAPFTGTLTNFAKQFISQQGEAATAAKQLADGQSVVLNTLQKKVTDASGVNIDDEMAHLLALQNAYSANARVMSSIKQMYDTLIQRHVRVSCLSMALTAGHPISGPRSSNLRNQLDDLTQQLASGRVSTTYAGQGANRGFALSLRAQVSSIDAFKDTANNVNTQAQRRQPCAAGNVRHRKVGQKCGRHVDHRAQRQRANLRPDHGAGRVLERGLAAQQPVR